MQPPVEPKKAMVGEVFEVFEDIWLILVFGRGRSGGVIMGDGDS